MVLMQLHVFFHYYGISGMIKHPKIKNTIKILGILMIRLHKKESLKTLHTPPHPAGAPWNVQYTRLKSNDTVQLFWQKMQ